MDDFTWNITRKNKIKIIRIFENFVKIESNLNKIINTYSKVITKDDYYTRIKHQRRFVKKVIIDKYEIQPTNNITISISKINKNMTWANVDGSKLPVDEDEDVMQLKLNDVIIHQGSIWTKDLNYKKVTRRILYLFWKIERLINTNRDKDILQTTINLINNL